MGLTKEDVEKAREAGVTDVQLQRLAGNGIVPNAVSHLMEHLYQAVYDPSYVYTDEKLSSNNPHSN